MEKKISHSHDILARGIRVWSYLITPESKKNVEEEFTLFPTWATFLQSGHPDYSLSPVWKIENMDSSFQERVNKVLDLLEKIDPSKYQVEAPEGEKLRILVRLIDGERSKAFRLNGLNIRECPQTPG